MTSTPELTLAAQLEQDHIAFEREFRFHPERRWRSDFMVGPNMAWPVRGRYLIEIDGGAWTQGRHVRGKGFEADRRRWSSPIAGATRSTRGTSPNARSSRCCAGQVCRRSGSTTCAMRSPR